jgi:hypothetical protein
MDLKDAIESMYTDNCTITIFQSVKDPATNITSQQEVTSVSDQPCRLSHRSSEPVNIVNGVGVQAQTIKLFISPDIAIKPGSKISVTRNGQTTDYKNSGIPNIFDSHQEIGLVIFDGWS